MKKMALDIAEVSRHFQAYRNIIAPEVEKVFKQCQQTPSQCLLIEARADADQGDFILGEHGLPDFTAPQYGLMVSISGMNSGIRRLFCRENVGEAGITVRIPFDYEIKAGDKFLALISTQVHSTATGNTVQNLDAWDF